MTEQTVQQLGRYVLVEPLGQGGMGQVWLGYLLGADGVKSPCAIKLLQNAESSEDHLNHLRREAKLSSQLKHNSLGTFYEFATADNLSFLVMEFIEGVTLLDVLADAARNSRALPLEYALHIGIQIASGLDYLHRFRDPETGIVAEVVHGDLTPQNVMINFEGEVKIIDLGLARLHVDMQGNSLDTKYASLLYASPNRIKSKRISPSDDLFALGILLWELFTVSQYHAGKSAQDIVADLKEFTPVDPRTINPEIPPAIAKIVLSCLESESFNGYASAGEALQDLQKELVRTAPEFVPAQFREYICSVHKDELEKAQSRRTRDLTSLNRFEASTAKAKAAGEDIEAPPTFKLPPKGSGEQSRSGGTTEIDQANLSNISKQKKKAPPIAPLEPAQPSIGQSKVEKTAATPPPQKAGNSLALPALMIAGLVLIGAIAATKFFGNRKASSEGQSQVSAAPAADQETTVQQQGPGSAASDPAAAGAAAASAVAPEAAVQLENEIEIKSVPEGARVWVNGEPVSRRTPTKVSLDQSRSAVIKLKHDEFREFSIMVDSSKKTLNVDLEMSTYSVE